MVWPLAIVAVMLLLALAVVIALLLTGAFSHNNPDERAYTNSNAPNSVATPTAPATRSTPSPKPTNTPANTNATPALATNRGQAEEQVQDAMRLWAKSIRERNLSDNLSLYADQLESFYGSRNVVKGSVRSNRQQIFDRYYSSTDVRLSNVRVEVDSNGARAKVLYDNTYSWQGDRPLAGKSHNEIIMSRINGRWLIVSEIDLGQ
jgi:ketosteroid isomerase-like protein